jgi:hypothetical protein
MTFTDNGSLQESIGLSLHFYAAAQVVQTNSMLILKDYVVYDHARRSWCSKESVDPKT